MPGKLPRYPSLYEVNTRVRLSALSGLPGRQATLDDIPDAELDRLAALGFDWIWFLGIWQTGPAARAVSLSNPEWLAEFRRTLPDFTDADVTGSCFSVRDYRAHRDFGGDEALVRLRRRLHKRGLRLMLDFVPNHVAPDHAWVTEHPDFFIAGDEDRLAREPQNYTRAGGRILAYGRDPNFSGWPDTLQLDYANPALQEAMKRELLRVAALSDGVRCDMAMLLLPEVFERTWGRRPELFWPDAIARVKSAHPGFRFMAEAYWDLEWTLQQQGFDYCYDKRLYDRLLAGQARPVREHLMADIAFQDRLARFLENHDEARAAAAFAPGMQEAAAIVTYLTPGLRFMHMGQWAGKRTRISAHLGRGPEEIANPELRCFYQRLMRVLDRDAVRNGQWQLAPCEAACDENGTWDDFIAFAWRGDGEDRLLVVANYSARQSQCYARVPVSSGGTWRLRDLLGANEYIRDGDDLAGRGLYLDLPAWGYRVFEVDRV